MQSNCESTNDQMNHLLPLLLFSDTDSDSNMKTLLLMQAMSEGNRGLDLTTMMPFLLMEEESDSDSLLLMVMMNSMTGDLDSQEGFANNFNMLLPLLMGEDDSEGDMDMLVILMAMQSQSPGSAMGANAMLPLLMMDSESDNQDLIFFMMMNSNQKC